MSDAILDRADADAIALDMVRRKNAIWRRLLRDVPALLALTFLVLVVLAAILAPWITPADPYANKLMLRFTKPWTEGRDGVFYWLGTDNQGRDMVARLLFGMRSTLAIGVTAVLCGGSVGACGASRKPLAALGLGLTAALRVRLAPLVGAGLRLVSHPIRPREGERRTHEPLDRHRPPDQGPEAAGDRRRDGDLHDADRGQARRQAGPGRLLRRQVLRRPGARLRRLPEGRARGRDRRPPGVRRVQDPGRRLRLPRLHRRRARRVPGHPQPLHRSGRRAVAPSPPPPASRATVRPPEPSRPAAAASPVAGPTTSTPP